MWLTSQGRTHTFTFRETRIYDWRLDFTIREAVRELGPRDALTRAWLLDDLYQTVSEGSVVGYPISRVRVPLLDFLLGGKGGYNAAIKDQRRRIENLAAAVLIGGLLTACGSAAETASTEGESQSQVVVSQAATEDARTEEVETEETEEADAVAALEVVEYGFTQLDGGEDGSPGVTYGAIFANNGTAIASGARAQITFEDADGVVVDTVEEYLEAVLPDSSVALGDFVFDATEVDTMTVQVLPGTTEELEGEPANFAVSGITTREEEFGGFKTTATVSSPFTRDLEDLKAVAIYRDDAGQITGGAYTFLGFVPAGGEAAVSIDDFVQGLSAPASTEVYIAITSLTLLADM